MKTPGTTHPDNPYTTRRVQAPGGELHVIDQPGAEPAIVLMHGFPDDWRIYRKLIPHLAPRRAVAFDFLGYGHSGRPERPDPGQHEADLIAVLDHLRIGNAVLAGHDAGGPVAVNVTLGYPDRISRLVLMNTYYGTAPQLRFPEMIRLFADQNFAPLADAIAGDPDQRLWLLAHTARQFGPDPLTPGGLGLTSVIPQFFGEDGTPDALAAIRAWTRALFPALAEQDATIASGQLAALDVPVSLIYGARDDYLNPALARHLASLFSHADLHLIDGASHWPQADQPEAVAQILKDVR
jgi:pimeloyl-ACP methyl ester carboxylesterase